jgi:hypothetical protein
MKANWARMSASAGIWAALWLAVGYAITLTTVANPAASDADYVRALVAERMKWEWVTFVRLLGGILVLWFMGNLAGRLRLAEGGPGRLASAAFGVGVIWAGVWLLSGFFNSASIALAVTYDDPAGSRIAGVLAGETPSVLTPIVVFTLLLATSLVAPRLGAAPRIYTFGTAALTIAFPFFTVADWAGPGHLSPFIVGASLAWMGITSALLVSRSESSAIAGGLR